MAVKFTYPAMTGTPKPGKYYRIYSARYTTPEQVKIDFFRRYGEYPDVIFIGPPRGIHIYAGPVRLER